MRRLAFDPYEFDSPASEESLDIVVSSECQHPTLAKFLADCGASSHAGGPPPAGWNRCRWDWMTGAVRVRTGQELPPIEECQVLVLSDAWDDVELVVVSGSVLVWYHWWTTA